LTERLGRNVSFTSQWELTLPPACTTRNGDGRATNLAGPASRWRERHDWCISEGRIWCHRRDRVDQLVAWCRHIGVKLRTSRSIEAVLRGTLETVIVTARPTEWLSLRTGHGRFIPILSRHGPSRSPIALHISQVELEVIDATLAGPIRFAIEPTPHVRSLSWSIFSGEKRDYRFAPRR
jgi:hypothetical protein